MNERLDMISFTLVDPTNTNAIGALQFYFDCLVDMTIVGVSCAPEVADAGATIDIDDDGTNVITTVAAATVATPGTWKSTALGGGTNAPVHIAAGSKVSFDANSAAAATAFHVVLWVLFGEAST